MRRPTKRNTLATIIGCPNCGGVTEYVVNTKDAPGRYRHCLKCGCSFHIRYNRSTKQWYRLKFDNGK